MDPSTNQHQAEFERAVGERLAQLRTAPVDTALFDERLRQVIPPPRQVSRRWVRPLVRLAAVLVLAAAILGLWFGLSAQQVMASPAQMAQMHKQLVSDPRGVMQVDSIEAAGSALAAMWPAMPELPQVTEEQSIPRTHVMACCLRSVKDKTVACVLLKREQSPVTMVVAKASDLRLPPGQTVTRNGVTYYLQSSSGVNMVMVRREGRWVCVMGELPNERLMELASDLQF